MFKRLVVIFLLCVITYSEVYAGEEVEVKSATISIEVDQTKPNGKTWDSSLLMFGNIVGPDLRGLIAINKKGCDIDSLREWGLIDSVIERYKDGLSNNSYCIHFNIEVSETLELWGRTLGSTKNLYQLNIVINKPFKMAIGEEIYFEIADQDEGTANDDIGRGSLFFNGDRVLEGRMGAMNVRAEFTY